MSKIPARTIEPQSETDSSFQRLPNEILLSIIELLEGASLKSLRLVNRVLAQLSESFLFGFIVVCPTVDCLRGFISLLANTSIAQHVLKVDYDCSWSGVKTTFTHGSWGSQHPLERRDDEFLATIREAHFQRPADVPLETALLVALLQLLPCVHTILVFEEKGYVNDILRSLLPQYIRRLCRERGISESRLSPGVPRAQMGTCPTQSILTAVSVVGRSVKVLEARDTRWEDWADDDDWGANFFWERQDLFRHCLSQLEQLTVSFDLVFDTIRTSEKGQRFSNFLYNASHLKLLRLRMTRSRVYTERPEAFGPCQFDFIRCLLTYLRDHQGYTDLGNFEEGPYPTVRAPFFHQLVALDLGSVFCYRRNLLFFLEQMSSTLRFLTLKDMTLKPRRSSNLLEAQKPCWVHLLKCIRTALRLKCFALDGDISNSGLQAWEINNWVEGDCVKERVQLYMIDQRMDICPIEQLAIQPGEDDVTYVTANPAPDGDDSWIVRYPRGSTPPATYQILDLGVRSGSESAGV